MRLNSSQISKSPFLIKVSNDLNNKPNCRTAFALYARVQKEKKMKNEKFIDYTTSSSVEGTYIIKASPHFSPFSPFCHAVDVNRIICQKLTLNEEKWQCITCRKWPIILGKIWMQNLSFNMHCESSLAPKEGGGRDSSLRGEEEGAAY